MIKTGDLATEFPKNIRTFSGERVVISAFAATGSIPGVGQFSVCAPTSETAEILFHRLTGYECNKDLIQRIWITNAKD